MIRVFNIPHAFRLRDSMARFYWSDNGSRWIFPDNEFMRKRELIGLDTHIIHFHNGFCVDLSNGKEAIFHDPVIQFEDAASLVHFRLIL